MDPRYEFETKEYYIEYGKKEGFVEGYKEVLIKDKRITHLKDIEAVTNYLMEKEHLSYLDAFIKAVNIFNGSY